jgi:MoxR-like ATPase
MESKEESMDTEKLVSFKNKIVDTVSKVMIGKEDVIELVVIAFICSGHILIEDIPGVGKTTLIKAFAKTLGCNFKRIQFILSLCRYVRRRVILPCELPASLTARQFIFQQDS